MHNPYKSARVRAVSCSCACALQCIPTIQSDLIGDCCDLLYGIDAYVHRVLQTQTCLRSAVADSVCHAKIQFSLTCTHRIDAWVCVCPVSVFLDLAFMRQSVCLSLRYWALNLQHRGFVLRYRALSLRYRNLVFFAPGT